MTPQELKNSILQLAIQGKLVEQRPEEGTAEELYQQIQAEKQALIKSGKIKKEKPLPEIAEDEKPFDIPESWKWMRLGECSTYSSAKEKISPSDITGDMWSLDLEDIEKETGKIVNYCFAKNRKITGDKVVFHSGQILYSKLRPYLKKILVAPKNGICTPELVPFSMIGAFENAYILYVLKAPHIDFVINSVTYGVKMPRVGIDTMVNLLIPVPPLAEQKRIVAKIEELLPLIDRYEEAWTKLEEFNKRFPGDMQKSLLQMAIQGKLVEQRPEEGTARELLDGISIDDSVDGRRVKVKIVSQIVDDDKTFDIPESWEWVKLGNICTIARGGSPRPIKEYITTAPDGVNWIKIGDTEKNGKYISSTAEKIKPSGVSKSRMVHAGDFLLTNSMSFGRPYILKVDGCIHDGWLVISQSSEVFDQDYLYWMLSSGYAYSQFCEKVSGAVVKNLNSDKVANAVFPLPPLAEQKRIVDKLEELLPLCERLK